MSRSDIKNTEHTLRMCGTWNIGSKWQIVIPKEIREVLWLESGDSVSFLLKDEKFIWIVPNTDLQLLMDYIQSDPDITIIK